MTRHDPDGIRATAPALALAATAAAFVFFFLLLAAVPVPLAGQAAGAEGTDGGASPAPFGIDDAIDLVEVSDPRIAPGGDRVLFVRSVLDWEENERDRRIWIVGADGGDPRPFTGTDGDADPRWSPDGDWIAFRRRVGEEEERRSQLFLIRADGGEARQLTEHSTSVGPFAWSEEGDELFFVADDSLTDDEEEQREDGYDAVFVNEGPNGQERGDWSNLWRVAADPDSGAARPVTRGERIVDDFAVAPSGDRIAFTYRTEDHRNDPWRSEIALVDVASGEVRDLTANEAPESDLAWSPDGERLVFVAPDRERWRLDQGNLYLMDPATGETRQLAAGFRPALAAYRWAPDGRSLVVVAQDGTDRDLFRVPVAADSVRRLTSLGGSVGPFTLSADGTTVAYEFESPTRPGDLYRADLSGSAEPDRLTRANPALEEKPLAEPELVRWAGPDGLEIEGLLYRPPATEDGRAGGWSAPGALVLEIHGGPAGVFGRSFDSDAQLLAAHGYAVLQPNVRGSSGYGDEFLRGNMEDIGGGDYGDLMAGVDTLVAREVAHPDSLAVKGWSYGGILGGWTLTRTDRFRAASLGAMVSDWSSEYGVGFHFDVVRWYLGGTPWSNAAHWRERSAYTHMDEVETPTILFHGAGDDVDTPGQSMNFHQALRHFGVPTRFVLFPREGHGIREPRHDRTRRIEELRWFQRHVRGDEDWTAPERPEGS